MRKSRESTLSQVEVPLCTTVTRMKGGDPSIYRAKVAPIDRCVQVTLARPPRGKEGEMSHQVKAYGSKEEYLNPFTTERGIPVSDKFETFEEAAAFRDSMVEVDKEHFYGICHFTQVAVIDVAQNGSEKQKQLDKGEQ